MRITQGMAEVVGIYIGDGHIYREKNKFQIGFTGSPKTDVSLFKRLKELIKKEWEKDVKYKVRERGLRIVFRSKVISDFLIKDLKLPYGIGKCEKVQIPKEIYNDWNLVKYTIRGIMDTDGTVFVSKKPGIEKYPTMEITTTSQVLAQQIHEILSERGYRLGKIREFSRPKVRKVFRVALYGRENIRKWLKEIGFSNEYKKQRAVSYTQ